MDKKYSSVENLRRVAAPVALALGVAAMGACTEAEPAVATSTKTSESLKGGEQDLSPEAMQGHITDQLISIFDKVYSIDLSAQSVERQPAEEYGDLSYFEASAILGERKLTVIMEAPGTGFEPDQDNASFVMARVAALNKGGESTIDNPDGSVTLAQISVTSPVGFRPETVGFDSVAEFSTREFEGEELLSQLESAQSAINQVEEFFNTEG